MYSTTPTPPSALRLVPCALRVARCALRVAPCALCLALAALCLPAPAAEPAPSGPSPVWGRSAGGTAPQPLDPTALAVAEAVEDATAEKPAEG